MNLNSGFAFTGQSGGSGGRGGGSSSSGGRGRGRGGAGAGGRGGGFSGRGRGRGSFHSAAPTSSSSSTAAGGGGGGGGNIFSNINQQPMGRGGGGGGGGGGSSNVFSAAAPGGGGGGGGTTAGGRGRGRGRGTRGGHHQQQHQQRTSNQPGSIFSAASGDGGAGAATMNIFGGGGGGGGGGNVFSSSAGASHAPTSSNPFDQASMGAGGAGGNRKRQNQGGNVFGEARGTKPQKQPKPTPKANVFQMGGGVSAAPASNSGFGGFGRDSGGGGGNVFSAANMGTGNAFTSAVSATSGANVFGASANGAGGTNIFGGAGAAKKSKNIFQTQAQSPTTVTPFNKQKQKGQQRKETNAFDLAKGTEQPIQNVFQATPGQAQSKRLKDKKTPKPSFAGFQSFSTPGVSDTFTSKPIGNVFSNASAALPSEVISASPAPSSFFAPAASSKSAFGKSAFAAANASTTGGTTSAFSVANIKKQEAPNAFNRTKQDRGRNRGVPSFDSTKPSDVGRKPAGRGVRELVLPTKDDEYDNVVVRKKVTSPVFPKAKRAPQAREERYASDSDDSTQKTSISSVDLSSIIVKSRDFSQIPTYEQEEEEAQPKYEEQEEEEQQEDEEEQEEEEPSHEAEEEEESENEYDQEAYESEEDVGEPLIMKQHITSTKARKMNASEFVLEARRYVHEKFSSVSSKVTTSTGKCLEMCPAYQIDLREVQGDISIFERDPKQVSKIGEIDKSVRELCVKKYERSAADKATPPPEHLRPPYILMLTMNYLIDMIVDQTAHSFNDMYEFVRDRCRSISQDLTYQNIRDSDCVELHEQIVRFHIFCQHRLAQQEDYDPQPNMNLMNNYLKNLREVYAEHNQRGLICLNQSEFSAYYILTRVGSSSGTSEIVRFLRSTPQEVYRSPDVKFALQVNSAFNESNWIRFFKLVEQATYLQSCLLFNLFTSVRETALRMMNDNFNVRKIKNKEQYDLKLLMEQLLFENQSEAINFCRVYNVCVDRNNIIFNEKPFVEPQRKPKAHFNTRFIESKIESDTTNAEIIRSEIRYVAEPVVVQPSPPASRSERRKSSLVISTPILAPPSPLRPVVVPQPKIATPLPDKRQVPSEPIKTPLSSRRVPSPIISAPMAIQPFPSVPSTMQEQVPFITIPSISPVQSQKTPVFPTNQEPETRFTPEYIPSIASESIPTPQVPDMAKQQKLKAAADMILQKRRTILKKCFDAWRQFAQEKQAQRARKHEELKRVRRELAEQFSSHQITLPPNFDMVVGLKEQQKKEEQERLFNELYAPSDIPSLSFPALSAINHEHSVIYWKMVVCRSDHSREQYDIVDWIDSKLSMHQEKIDDDTLCSGYVQGNSFISDFDEMAAHDSRYRHQSMQFCVKQINVNDGFEDASSLRGTSCVMYILPSITANEDNYWHEQSECLMEFLKTIFNNYYRTSIPLVVVYDQSKLHETQYDVLKKVYDIVKNVASQYDFPNPIRDVICVPFEFEAPVSTDNLHDQYVYNVSKQLDNCIQWLAERSPVQPTFNTYSLSDLLEDSCDNYFQKSIENYNDQYLSDLRKASSATAHNENIQSIVIPAIPIHTYCSQFNAICEALCNFVTADQQNSMCLNWPAPEFADSIEPIVIDNHDCFDMLYLPESTEDDTSESVDPTNTSNLEQLFYTKLAICTGFLREINEHHSAFLEEEEEHNERITPYVSAISNLLLSVLRNPLSNTESKTIVTFMQILQQFSLFHLFYLNMNALGSTKLQFKSEQSYDKLRIALRQATALEMDASHISPLMHQVESVLNENRENQLSSELHEENEEMEMDTRSILQKLPTPDISSPPVKRKYSLLDNSNLFDEMLPSPIQPYKKQKRSQHFDDSVFWEELSKQKNSTQNQEMQMDKHVNDPRWSVAQMEDYLEQKTLIELSLFEHGVLWSDQNEDVVFE